MSKEETQTVKIAKKETKTDPKAPTIELDKDKKHFKQSNEKY